MTIGPEPISRIFRRSVRFGNEPLLFQDPVDDRGLRRRLFAAVEDVVEPARADPDHFAVAPQLLPEHAHPLLDALLDGVALQRALALRGERRPLRRSCGRRSGTGACSDVPPYRPPAMRAANRSNR